jgi:hypothetical protein
MRVALIACWLFAAPLHAAHPLMTEDTGTLGDGRWQVELFGEAGEARGTGARMDRDDAVLGYGLAPELDLRAGMPWIRERASGMGDITLDLKWRFLERGAFSLGLKPGVSLPTGDERKGLGAGRVGWGSLLIASYEPGPFALHAHAGYKRNRNTIGERQSLTHISIAATVQAAPGLKVVADAASNSNPDPAQTRPERYLVFGVIWSVTRDFDLDFGFKKGFGSAALDEALLLGLTARW